MKLDDLVLSVVQEFVKNGMLFTALDVSNKVKENLPQTRHREVRDLVRNLFALEIEPAGYARTPITVTLNDGSSAEALLYHSLQDYWDLDTKYDTQKRNQESLRLTAPQAIPVNVASIVTPAATDLSLKDKWANLLQSQPLLVLKD